MARKFTIAHRMDTSMEQTFKTFNSWSEYQAYLTELKDRGEFVQENYLTSIVLTKRVSLKEKLQEENAI